MLLAWFILRRSSVPTTMYTRMGVYGDDNLKAN
jgi:hypothetical protein